MYRLTITYGSEQVKSSQYDKFKDAEKVFMDKKRGTNVAKIIIHRITTNKAPKVMLWYG